MEKKFDRDIFNTVYSLVPLIREMFNENVCIAISDTKEYIYYIKGANLSVPIHEGYNLSGPLGVPATKAMANGECYKAVLPKEVTPTDNTCYFYPLRENDEIVGVVGIAVDQSYRNEFIAVTDKLYEAIGNIFSELTEVSNGSQQIHTKNSELLSAIHNAADKSKDSEQIISIIKNISSKTNLLGLNASIEAARVGEIGRGFTVVATEISKLATNTKESINKIESIVNDISEQIANVDEGLDTMNAVTQEQSNTLEAITVSLKQIKENVGKMHELTKNI